MRTKTRSLSQGIVAGSVGAEQSATDARATSTTAADGGNASEQPLLAAYRQQHEPHDEQQPQRPTALGTVDNKSGVAASARFAVLCFLACARHQLRQRACSASVLRCLARSHAASAMFVLASSSVSSRRRSSWLRADRSCLVCSRSWLEQRPVSSSSWRGACSGTAEAAACQTHRSLSSSREGVKPRSTAGLQVENTKRRHSTGVGRRICPLNAESCVCMSLAKSLSSYRGPVQQPLRVPVPRQASKLRPEVAQHRQP